MAYLAAQPVSQSLATTGFDLPTKKVSGSEMLETSYRWLKNIVLLAVSNVDIDMARSLYRYVRIVFRQPELLKHFWFAIIGKETGMYLFDEEAAANAISIASQKASLLGVGPLTIASKMLTFLLPFDQISAKAAISDWTPINVELETAAYDDLLVKAETVMFGSDIVRVWPIARAGRGKGFLIAVYPSVYKENIDDNMELHRKELTDLFVYHQDRLERMLKDLETTVQHAWSAQLKQYALEYGPMAIDGIIKSQS